MAYTVDIVYTVDMDYAVDIGLRGLRGCGGRGGRRGRRGQGGWRGWGGEVAEGVRWLRGLTGLMWVLYIYCDMVRTTEWQKKFHSRTILRLFFETNTKTCFKPNFSRPRLRLFWDRNWDFFQNQRPILRLFSCSGQLNRWHCPYKVRWLREAVKNYLADFVR